MKNRASKTVRALVCNCMLWLAVGCASNPPGGNSFGVDGNHTTLDASTAHTQDARAQSDAGGQGIGTGSPDATDGAVTTTDDMRDASQAAPDAQTDGAAPISCMLSAGLRFSRGGGFINTSLVADLSSVGALTFTYSSNGPNPTDRTCTPSLPACGSAGIDISEIAHDLAQPDVQTALGHSPAVAFGLAAADSGTFHLDDAAGHSFDVLSRDCPVGSPDTCKTPPAGVLKLMDDLEALQAQALKDPACATLMQ